MLLAWHQARAERLLVAGDHAAAGEALADLRDKYPPRENHREWMRPWMLSLLLAQQAGDTATLAELAGQLGDHAGTAPLSPCLARSDERRVGKGCVRPCSVRWWPVP